MLRNVVFVLLVSVCAERTVADEEAERPATVVEARKVLDLATFPLVKGAEEPTRRNLAGLSYQASGSVAETFDVIKQEFAKRNWTEVPGGYSSGQYAAATLQSGDYKVSLSVSTGIGGNQARVSIIQHGNINFEKLPVPEGFETLYGGPVSVMYISPDSVEQTKEKCRALLMKNGWVPYGVAGDSLMFRQNAVQLTAMISAAPAQGGKTVAQFSSVLMSVELPAPPNAVNLQYSETPMQLFFDVDDSMDGVMNFYRDALAPWGWKQTTESYVKVSIYEVLIYRNPQKEMLKLQMHEFEGKTRVLLKYETADEVKRMDKLAQEEIAKREQERQRAAARRSEKLPITVPADAKNLKAEKNSISFNVTNGTAQRIAEGWSKQFTKEGWKQDIAVLDKMAGAISLSKEGMSLTIRYTDTGFLPAEVEIDSTGIQLEKSAK